MIKHIVLWKLKAEAEGKSSHENALWMKAHLEALLGVVPELKSCTVGIDVSGSEANYTAVLESTFENLEALQRYKIHPAHVEVSNYCKKIRESRVAIDYELEA